MHKITNIAITALLVMLPIMLSHATSTANAEKRSSRKRRYLVFPDSSSLQLVYDSTVTIPDFTLYVTTGITCALAWGLPTTPFSPDAMFGENEDELPASAKDRHDTNRTDSITPTTKVPSNVHNATDIEHVLWKYFNFLQNRRPDSYYFDNATHYNYCGDGGCSYEGSADKYGHDFGHRGEYKRPYTTEFERYQKYDAFTKYMVQNYFKPWMQYNANQKSSPHISTEYTTTTAKPAKTASTEFVPTINKLHTVFPAMGKRSIRDRSLTNRQKAYIDHHRDTRHQLYAILEEYLSAHGYNGTACILKTLCEVGQRRSEDEPGSFMAEIVRAVFSLPEAQLQRHRERRHIEYDDAHRTIDDCAATYVDCPASVWHAGFLIDLDDENTKKRLLRDNVLAATLNKI